MPKIDISETFDIPYDSLSNEQRLAIKLLMEGNALKNPVEEKVKKTKVAVEEEKKNVEEVEGLNEQHKSDILTLLDQLQDKLETFGVHTDKISGASGNDLTKFFERISVANDYTRIMKSITGKDEEKYSFIFATILEIGDSCLTKITQDLTCDDKATGSKCDGIIAGSGVKGLAEELKKNPSIAYDIITCHLPTIIECIDNSIVDEELNFCEAKKVIESYSAGSRVVGDEKTNPIYSQILKQVVASSELKQSLLEIAQKEADEDSQTRITSEFFKDFPKIYVPTTETTSCNGECCDPETELVPVYTCEEPDPRIQGPAGPPGIVGNYGPGGPVGPRGPDGENCECVEVGKGACCVNGEYCTIMTELQCLQIDGVYHGDDSVCELILCGTCETTVNCPYPEICCEGQCTLPCDDGTCPPCPQCPNGFFWCSASDPPACCPNGNCCTECSQGNCNSNIDCWSEAPYCCENNCSRTPCSGPPPPPPPPPPEPPPPCSDCPCDPNNADACGPGSSCVSDGAGGWKCEPDPEPPGPPEVEPCGPGYVIDSGGDCIPDPRVWPECDTQSDCGLGYTCTGGRCVWNNCLSEMCECEGISDGLDANDWPCGYPPGQGDPHDGEGTAYWDCTSDTDHTGPCYEQGQTCNWDGDACEACYEETEANGTDTLEICFAEPDGQDENGNPTGGGPCFDIQCPDEPPNSFGDFWKCSEVGTAEIGFCYRQNDDICCHSIQNCCSFCGCYEDGQQPAHCTNVAFNDRECDCGLHNCLTELGNWPDNNFNYRSQETGRSPDAPSDRVVSVSGERRVGNPGEFYTIRTGGSPPPFRSGDLNGDDWCDYIDAGCNNVTSCCCLGEIDEPVLCTACCCGCKEYCDTINGTDFDASGGCPAYDNATDGWTGFDSCCCCDNPSNGYTCGCCEDSDCGEGFRCNASGYCVDEEEGDPCLGEGDCTAAGGGRCCNGGFCGPCDDGEPCGPQNPCEEGSCCVNNACTTCINVCGGEFGECAEGLCCRNNYCQPCPEPQCSSSSECPTNQCCYFGECSYCGPEPPDGGGCGCVAPCAGGGGCGDCIIGGTVGCCPPGQNCCGGNDCCTSDKCCGGNKCCNDDETCCNGSCCPEYLPECCSNGDCCGGDYGTCCGESCCPTDQCCVLRDGVQQCVPPCPQGWCPENWSCNDGCGCIEEGQKCCEGLDGGTCCSASGPCCPSNGSDGCPCGTYTDNDGNTFARVCCPGVGCCPDGHECCDGVCQEPDPFNPCCTTGNQCEGNGWTRCCGDNENEPLGCCYDDIGSPFCCNNCCDIDCDCGTAGGSGQICADSPLEEPGVLNGCCGGLGYCQSCWPDRCNWKPGEATYDGQGCDCGCNQFPNTKECTGEDTSLKYCCNALQNCCGEGCCGSTETCCTYTDAEGDFHWQCCPNSDCCCPSETVQSNGNISVSFGCCEDDEACCEDGCVESDNCNTGCDDGDQECKYECTGTAGSSCCEGNPNTGPEFCCEGICYEEGECCAGCDRQPHKVCPFGCCPNLDTEGAVVCRTAENSIAGCPCPCDCDGVEPNCTRPCSSGQTGTIPCGGGEGNCSNICNDSWVLIGCTPTCHAGSTCTELSTKCGDGFEGCGSQVCGGEIFGGGGCCYSDNVEDPLCGLELAKCTDPDDGSVHVKCCDFSTDWCGTIITGSPCVKDGECWPTCSNGECPAGSTRNEISFAEDGSTIITPSTDNVYVNIEGGCNEGYLCPCGDAIGATTSCTEGFAPPNDGDERSMPPSNPNKVTQSLNLRQHPDKNLAVAINRGRNSGGLNLSKLSSFIGSKNIVRDFAQKTEALFRSLGGSPSAMVISPTQEQLDDYNVTPEQQEFWDAFCPRPPDGSPIEEYERYTLCILKRMDFNMLECMKDAKEVVDGFDKWWEDESSYCSGVLNGPAKDKPQEDLTPEEQCCYRLMAVAFLCAVIPLSRCAIEAQKKKIKFLEEHARRTAGCDCRISGPQPGKLGKGNAAFCNAICEAVARAKRQLRELEEKLRESERMCEEGKQDWVEGCQVISERSTGGPRGQGIPNFIALVKPKAARTSINIKFQIVNFLASEGIKTDVRTEVTKLVSAGLFSNSSVKALTAGGYKDSKSKSSLSEIQNNSAAIGEPGSEFRGTVSEEIKGTLTTTIMSDGTLGRTMNMTFVAGSNIRLDTNTEANFIRINVDDISLDDVLGMSLKSLTNGSMMNYQSSNGSWVKRTGSNPTGNVGPTGASPELVNPFSSSYRGVVFNQGGTAATLSAGISFDAVNSFEVVGEGNFTDGFSAGGPYVIANDVNRPKFFDTSEGATATFGSSGLTQLAHAVSWADGAVQYITATGGGAAGSTAIFPILNMAVTGEAKSITLIITNGGQYAQGSLVANGVWAGGSQPTLSTDGIDIVSIMNVYDGSQYGINYCFHNGTGMA